MAFSAMNQSEIAEVPNCPRKTEPPTLNRLQSHRIARVFPGRKLFLFLPLKKTSDLLGLAQENKGATAGRNSTCRSSLSSLLFVMSQHLKKMLFARHHSSNDTSPNDLTPRQPDGK